MSASVSTRELYAPETELLRRRARATGTVVALVYDAAADSEQPWETVCVEHGGVCSHPTRKLAESHLPYPDGWCEDCMGLERDVYVGAV